MRSIVLIVLAAAAVTGSAQDKKVQTKAPASFAELNDQFDAALEAAQKKVKTDRLAALEAYLADKANAAKADALDAQLAAADLASDLSKWDVAKMHAEAVVAAAKTAEQKPQKIQGHLIAARASARQGAKIDVVRAHCDAVRDAASAEDRGSVFAALEASEVLAGLLVDNGDKEGAMKTWDDLSEKIQVQGLTEHIESKKNELKPLGEPMNAFPEGVKDTEGKPLSFDEYKGKVLFVDFWATWCGPCMQEMPTVVAAYKKYQSKGFEILGISLDNEQSIKKMPEIMKAKGMTWRQHADGKGWQNEVAQHYEIQSIPATYLLDREGRVYRIGLTGDALGAAIEKLLAAKPAAPAAPTLPAK